MLTHIPPPTNLHDPQVLSIRRLDRHLVQLLQRAQRLHRLRRHAHGRQHPLDVFVCIWVGWGVGVMTEGLSTTNCVCACGRRTRHKIQGRTHLLQRVQLRQRLLLPLRVCLHLHLHLRHGGVLLACHGVVALLVMSRRLRECVLIDRRTAAADDGDWPNGVAGLCLCVFGGIDGFDVDVWEARQAGAPIDTHSKLAESLRVRYSRCWI